MYHIKFEVESRLKDKEQRNVDILVHCENDLVQFMADVKWKILNSIVIVLNPLGNLLYVCNMCQLFDKSQITHAQCSDSTHKLD